MSYCTADDVEDRLSAVGVSYLVDDNASESVDASEEGFIQSAIDAVATEIDGALGQFFTSPRTSGSGNEWLLHRCVDLAAERLCGRKGHKVPQSITDAATRSRDWLEEVRKGDRRVPGMTYPGDSDDLIRRTMGFPMVANPGDRVGGRR